MGGAVSQSPRLLPWERLKVFPDMRVNTLPDHAPSQHDTSWTRLVTHCVTSTSYTTNSMVTNHVKSPPIYHTWSTRLSWRHYSNGIMDYSSQHHNGRLLLSCRYPREFELTSSHKLRSSDDMQFAFSYFYFMMSEKETANYSAIFNDELDTDKTGYDD